MNSYRVFGTLLAVIIAAFMISCKPSASADTASENNTSAVEPYKEADMVDPAAFEKGMKKSNTILLDVRMPQEFEQGHIEGAVNINFFDPNFKNRLLDLDKRKKYYVYCKNDARSERAAEFMLQNDFPEVYVLKGGYEAWK